ncbi:HAMP domain-containing protein [Nakamurella antarctica]|uniref:histidine kinase n=1 Tax=Nakamurella antarctica TaxID=1902245 RepID=A0A3G8ZYZ8_9ACTN|nr:ATP-binding protein [Nakamurella antarctica]AZI58791.1 HAMP domain-containing protein [Nakamurella antarctica]
MRVELNPERWNVRLRSAFASVVVVGFALVAASGLLLFLLKHSLENAGRADAQTRTQQLVAALRTEPAAQLDQILLANDGNTLLTQILDSSGAIVQASAGAPAIPMTPERPSVGEYVDAGRTELGDDLGRFLVVAQGAAGIDGNYVVIVGSSQEATESVLHTVALFLVGGIPLILAVTGVANFWLVGRSLRPVESIRRRVSEISSADLSERVPVPAASDEIAQLATTMNDMLARLESGQLAQRRFVGDASHELRSPLSTIVAGLELVQYRPALLDKEMVAGTLLPEARRMQQLVSDLLLLASADERGLHPRFADVDIDDLLHSELRRIKDVHHRGPDAPAVAITHSIAAVQVVGDASQLTRAIRNISDNALRHSRSRVHIVVEELAEHVAVSVSDDGPGIATVDRERALARFVRLDDDRARSGGGTGLGLAITQEIVAAHHGRVVIDESEWGGAKVTLLLPRTQPTSR